MAQQSPSGCAQDHTRRPAHPEAGFATMDSPRSPCQRAPARATPGRIARASAPMLPRPYMSSSGVRRSAIIRLGRSRTLTRAGEAPWPTRPRPHRRAHPARFPVHRHGRRRRGRRRRPRLALRRLHGARRRDRRRRRAGRARPRADRRGADRQGVLARQADLRPPPHAEEIKAAEDVNLADPARPAARLGARQGGPRPVARRLRQLHPSRLRAARQPGRRTRAGSAPATARSSTPPAGSAAARRPDQPADPALHLRVRHQDPHRRRRRGLSLERTVHDRRSTP